MQNNITITDNFKSKTIKAILSIIIFAIVYLLIIAFAIALTVLSTYGGVMLIIAKPMFITIMVGAGLASMGLLVLIFLFKFIFKQNKIDLSHLTEIHPEQEPKIFQFINEIALAVGTSFPKRVYLSPDVNASVFYDSSFWSMFFPIKKNLQIGIGLVNTLTVSELKAVIAHEFGHFSQRSMKIGSYVYNVNQILYNLLYDNSSFEDLVRKWENINSYFAFFIALSAKIVAAIQWILRKVYELVNINYLSLSREMEFHADQVAANVAGSDPMATSLQRLSLSDYAYESVLTHYNEKVSEAIITDNIYPQQSFVMNLISEDKKLLKENNLPQVDLEEINRFDKSKLNFKNQWASHPSTEDRVHQLKKYNLQSTSNNISLAGSLFKDFNQLQIEITNNLFELVEYPKPTKTKSIEEFQKDYQNEFNNNSYDKIYNGYYERKNPTQFELDEIVLTEEDKSLELQNLFGDSNIDLVYDWLAFENDLQTLKDISSGNLKIRSFDYDGVKYKRKQSADLITKLEQELNTIKQKINLNDKNIYKYFLLLAGSNGNDTTLKTKYSEFFSFDKAYDNKIDIYVKMMNGLAFIQQSTPFDVIEKNFVDLKIIEKNLKEEIKQFLSDSVKHNVLTSEIRSAFETYLAKDRQYFFKEKYNDEALSILYRVLNFYPLVLSKIYFIVKKDLIDYQSFLINKVS